MSNAAALELVPKGASLPEVLRSISREVVRPTMDVRPVDVPKVVILGADASTAIAHFQSKTLVQAGTRRSLTDEEISSLLEERAHLDALEAFVKARKEAHRAMVFNHLDIAVDGSPMASTAEMDDKGHWLVEGSLTVEGAAKKFTREIRSGSPVLTADALEAAKDDETFTHDDYLACTSQVRVVDEAKVLLRLRERPQIVSALRKATAQGGASPSFNVRKA